ncbi:MAG: LptF/LptG family permease [Planctomycetes bacterium]|nr:LptF/LptG family permease [Planctomycetota bacterium]
MKRYDRYFLFIFVQSLVMAVALFSTVFIVVDVLLNLDKFQAFEDVGRGVFLFYAFNLPPVLYLLYPVVVFAAGMFSLARIIRSRELLLLEASGVSRKRALAAIMIPAALLGVLGLGLRQAVLPALGQAARESPYGAFEFRKGKRITLRDDQGNVWFVRRYNLDSRTLEDVRILKAGGDELLAAEEMRWVDGRGWWLSGPAEVRDLEALTSAGSGEGSQPRAVQGEPPFGHLLPADFARRRRSYAERTLTDLADAAAGLREDRELHVALWHEIWFPFAGFILLACGAGLVLSRAGRGPFAAGSLALGCMAGYQLLSFWFETMAQAGAMTPAVGAAITPLGFGVLGAVVFART